MSNEDGSGELVPNTYFDAPNDQLASILMSSPAPVGRFLICNAAITAPPYLSSGWPRLTRPTSLTPGGATKAVVTPFTPWKETAWLPWIWPEIWNRPQA